MTFLPRAVPHRIRHLGPAHDHDAGVGAEQVDLAEVAPCRGDQFGDAVHARGVPRYRQAADLAGNGYGGGRVQVVHDDAGARHGQSPGQRRADTATAAGHHDTGVLELHDDSTFACQS
jgi:hypothetical protein